MTTPPVAVQTESIHSTTRTESQGVTCLIHNACKRIGSWDASETIFWTVTAMNQICQITLEITEEKHNRFAVTSIFSLYSVNLLWLLLIHFLYIYIFLPITVITVFSTRWCYNASEKNNTAQTNTGCGHLGNGRGDPESAGRKCVWWQCLCSTHHNASVELVEALHCPITEAIAQILLHKVGVVKDVIGHKWLLQKCKSAFYFLFLETK